MQIYELILLGLLGGVIRVVIGYTKKLPFDQDFEGSQAVKTIIVSLFAGSIAALLVAEDPRVAVIAGIGGTDFLEALYRGLIRSKTGIIVSTTKRKAQNLNTRQRTALDYVEGHGSITAEEYEYVNSTTRKTAIKDLEIMAARKILKKEKIGKDIVYKTP